MTASQSQEPARRPSPDWVASLIRLAAAGLAIFAAFALLAAIISAIGHGVQAIEHDVDALTPRPGSVSGGWQTIYLAVFALVYGYLLYEARTGRGRLGYVLTGIAVLGGSCYLLSKTALYASYPYGPPVGSCGSWLTPSTATSFGPSTSYCVVKLDSLFRWGFAVAIGGLAVPLLHTARQQARLARASQQTKSP
jgi:hypothetical protein